MADHASFSRAAKILGVRQSAVGRRVRALEDDLGVSLFERQSNGARPTIAGQHFFERTRAALAEIDHAIKNAAAAGRGSQGMIRVGVPSSDYSDFLCDLLSPFRDAQPDVCFDYFEWPSWKLIAGVMDRRLDVAFAVSGTPAPGCDSETLWSASLCVAFSASHPLSGCDAIEWGVLKDEHFIFGREATAAGLADYAAERITKFGKGLSLTTFDISQGLVMRLVARNFGLSLVSSFPNEFSEPGVIFRPLSSDDRRVSYCAIWLPGNDNPALRRFLSLARARASTPSAPISACPSPVARPKPNA
ncbi:LysR family transcriptional regulator [Methylocystis sp.]|uniref:LysR family transcriptional regulator n=1 Tax=Methylocystis sp. TaxID=1911079 RepID=UPI0025F4E20E|nr:LysR family transcriptional regulator [Methylocystis sp.]